ncbi:uncharacterized protein EAE98_009631 [Botrytis deweyae]|uniref:Fungal-type protein kinase domain-containing protein n=1 Tax=Botrytis deweyae TaxID=2478750 RepID=A0ABQ7IB47_9HELO|nr:uncharacterized protein EAE98_009631 [Botrytis deweyae]KAF7918853.1 hypothetical protein EAE98_009631 [Botrytis deweyae]
MPIPHFLNDLRRTETEVSKDAQNEDEFNTIFEPFKKAISAIGYTPIALQIQQKHTPELSKPSKGYEACIKGCCIQIENMLSENESEIKYFLGMFNVHSVYVGTIRNYIDVGTFSDKTRRTIEHNVAVYSTLATLHSSSTPRAFSQISRGVTVPSQFLEVGGGCKNFWDREANNLDWYKIVLDTGRTRGTILKECTAGFFAKHANDLFRFGDSISDTCGATSNFSVYKIDYSKRDIVRIEFSSDKSNSDTTGSETTKTTAPEPKKKTIDGSNSATPIAVTSRSDKPIAISPHPKKPTPDGSKATTSKAAISIPVRPKSVTHRSERSERSGRSKAAPSEADKSTSDTTPLIKHRSDRPKSTPSKAARSGQETIKAAKTQFDKSLHKLDPRKLNSRQHKGYKELEGS